MTANFQIRVFGHGTENFKKYSVHCYSSASALLDFPKILLEFDDRLGI